MNFFTEEEIFEVDGKKFRLKQGIGCTLHKSFDVGGGRIPAVVHFEPFNRIVVGAESGKIYVLSGECGDYKLIEKVENIHQRSIRQVIKWDERTFITCGGDGLIISHDIETLKRNFVFSLVHERAPCGILKASEDLLISIDSHRIYVSSYSKNKVIRVIEGQKVDNFLNVSLSKFFKTSFYFNSCEGQRNLSRQNLSSEIIKLLNYETSKVTKEFSKHVNYTYCITSYVPSNEFYSHPINEILVSGGYNNIVYFYNSETEELLYKIKISSYIYTVKVFDGEYLFVGDFFGRIYLYQLKNQLLPMKLPGEMKSDDDFKKIEKTYSENDFSEELIFEFPVLGSDLVYGVEVVSPHGSSSDGILLAVHGKSASVVKINGIQFQDSLLSLQEIEDLNDRVTFLRGSCDLFLTEEEKGKIILALSLKNLIIDEIPRVFFLL